LYPDILADENISTGIIDNLRKHNFKVISVRDSYRGFKDIDIIELAVKMNSLILTEDSDFGEWIFSHKEKSTGVLYLRYELNNRDLINGALITVLKKYSMSLYQKFTVITPNKIRIREI
jgi:predicted nuclease of predicted toxin-antitoxin system